MTPRVLYFHGFASSPSSQKVILLRQRLGRQVRLDTPDMNVPSFERLDFGAMVDLAVREARQEEPKAIVGSSLGALLALELVRRSVHAPLILIAPALDVAARWKGRLPDGDPVMVYNHALGAQAPIHRAFFDGLATVRPEAAAPKVPVSIVMGRRDETVPFDLVRAVWEQWSETGLVAGSRFIEIAGGDHGLVAHVDVIGREVLAATGLL